MKKKRIVLFSLFILGMAFVFMSCGESSSTPQTPQAPQNQFIGQWKCVKVQSAFPDTANGEIVYEDITDSVASDGTAEFTDDGNAVVVLDAVTTISGTWEIDEESPDTLIIAGGDESEDVYYHGEDDTITVSVDQDDPVFFKYTFTRVE